MVDSLLEVLACQGKTERDHRGGVVQEQEEVPVEGEEAAVGWGEHALEPDPREVVSALIAGQKFPIKQELLAIT